MKNILLGCFLLLGYYSHSQISEHALGLRSGGSNAFGTEITYQKGLNGINRIQVDLGLHRINAAQAFKLTGTYQWVKPLENDFRWFYGFGAGIGYVDFDNSIPLIKAENFGTTLLSVEGIVGVEYSLARSAGIPLQLALDFNPNLNLFNDYYDDFDFDLALSVRWMF